MEQKKRGRPVITPGEKLEVKVCFNLSKELREQLKAICSEYKISLSEAIREAISVLVLNELKASTKNNKNLKQ